MPTFSDSGTNDVTTNVEASVDASSDGTVTIDTGVDAIEEPGPPLPCSTDASVCQGAIPTGWTLTMFSPNRNTACPSNSTTADIVENPIANAGACPCSCVIGTQPSCVLGSMTGKYGGDANCNSTNWGPWSFTTAGQCVDLGVSVTLLDYNQFSKLPLTKGTCTTSPQPDTSKLSSTPMRACVPSAACAEDVCSGQVPAGLRSCISSPGNVSCPAGPFTDKAAVVGTGATLACDACTACNVAASCNGTATVKYWDDINCTVAKGSITADGMCNATANQHTNHITYENPVQGVACNAGTSAAKADLTAKRTVCCRP